MPHDCEPHVAVDASFVINVYNKLLRQSTKIHNPHSDLRGQVVEHLAKRVRLTKVKSHLTLDEHVARGGESWSWHANAFADELASVTAESIAPYAVAEVNSWILERAKSLTNWVIPRIRYWLSHETARPSVVPDGPRRTKSEFFQQAQAKGFGGHVWLPHGKGLRCNACRSVLKHYRLLYDLEVIAALPCPGNGLADGCGHPLLHKIHFTHTMYGTSTLECRHCGGRLAGRCRFLSKKLQFPCGTSGAKLYRRRG